jgi:xanthine/CO dehydrogenase XdhC/CoxF family maturation factor
LGAEVGHEVTVVDFRSSLPVPRGAFRGIRKYIQCEPENLEKHLRFRNPCAVVVMTHHADDDLKALPLILRARPDYIGLLGPKLRGQRLLDEIQKNEPQLSTENIYFPVGLDVGAENPAEIALSILTEITAVRKGRKGGMLKDREGPIHFREEGLKS